MPHCLVTCAECRATEFPRFRGYLARDAAEYSLGAFNPSSSSFSSSSSVPVVKKSALPAAGPSAVKPIMAILWKEEEEEGEEKQEGKEEAEKQKDRFLIVRPSESAQPRRYKILTEPEWQALMFRTFQHYRTDW